MATFLSSSNTSRELQQARPSIAVIPVGATEQCGPCLPCNVDTLVAHQCARAYAEALGAYLAPLLPFNTSQEHSAFPGTISLSAPVLTVVLGEIVSELARQGFDKQVLVSPHGGSFWVPAFLRAINLERRDLIVVSGLVGADRSKQKALAASGLPRRQDLHGGIFTAATVSYLAPELVRPGDYGTEIDPKLQEFAAYGVWEKIAPDGAWGSLTAADRELDLPKLGRAYWEVFLAEQTKEVTAHLKTAASLKGIRYS
jgi:creatinine amidohydrolase